MKNPLLEFDLILVVGDPARTYPPYNIVAVDDNTFEIELAVAGFSETDISVQTVGDKLTIVGERPQDERNYLHKGISTRKFKSIFRLDPGVTISGADLSDGVLTVFLQYSEPEPTKIPLKK